jgi:electron transport complex protein RnfC
VQYFRFGKGLLQHQAQDTQKADHARNRFEARQARQARETAERQAQREKLREKRLSNSTSKQATTSQQRARFHHNTEMSPNPEQPSKAVKAPVSPNHANTAASAASPSADSLKTAYLKAEKRLKDLSRGLTHLEKQMKTTPNAEHEAKISTHREKIDRVQQEVNKLKQNWMRARSSQTTQQSQATPPRNSSVHNNSLQNNSTHNNSTNNNCAQNNCAQNKPYLDNEETP